MIFPQVRANLVPGTILPGTRYSVKGIYRRRGEAALVYRIPNRTDANGWYEKGVTESDCERAYERLTTSGEFSRAWFRENLPEADAEGPCNFIVIGKVFVLLGVAAYTRGKYTTRALAA